MITEEKRKQIVDAYIIEKLSLNSVAIKFGVSNKTVERSVKKYGYSTRDYSESHRIYNLNINYFEKIDNNNKAKILGFIGADGYLNYSGNKYLQINLNVKDLDYLQWIASEFEYNGNIKFFKNKGIDSTYCRLYIGDKRFCENLYNVGIRQKKSLTHPFPNNLEVPDTFITSYISGYFEGDGSISWGFDKTHAGIWAIIGICCTKEFGDTLSNILSENKIYSRLYRKTIHVNNGTNTYELKISHYESVCRFFDFIYARDTSFKMNRKYDKLKKFREMYDNNYVFLKTPEWIQEQSGFIGNKLLSSETREKMRQSAFISNKNRKLEENNK